jgi:hypothetical protein
LSKTPLTAKKTRIPSPALRGRAREGVLVVAAEIDFFKKKMLLSPYGNTLKNKHPSPQFRRKINHLATGDGTAS